MNITSILIDCCYALCMVTIGLMVIVYLQEKHDYEKRQRAIRRAREHRIMEEKARAEEIQLERWIKFDESQACGYWEAR